MKERIDYIDLMKGIGIFLVVMHHTYLRTHIEVVDKAVSNFFMPLYFFLSGLFFKRYSGFREFVLRKVNHLIVPYLFFAYIPFCLTDIFIHGFRTLPYYLIQTIAPYNYVLWFLKSLFLTYLWYYVFCALLRGKRVVVEVLVLVVVTVVACLMSLCSVKYGQRLDIPLRFNIEAFITSLFMLPFMWAGHWLMSHGYFTRKYSNKFLLVSFLVFLLLCLLCSHDMAVYSRARFGANPLFILVAAFSGIGACWAICYKVKRLPFFSLIGRYSLIVFGTHIPYIFLLKAYTDFPPSVNTLIVLALMPPTIWFFRRFFPRFVAQKDLLPVLPANSAVDKG